MSDQQALTSDFVARTGTGQLRQGLADAPLPPLGGATPCCTRSCPRSSCCYQPAGGLRPRASSGSAAATVAMLVVIATMMLPPQVVIVPMYLFWAKQLHLTGTLWPLIIPMAFGDAFSIFLLRQFLLTIPRSTSTRRRSTAAVSCGRCCASSSRWPAGDRGGRAVPVLLLLERLLRAADLRQREPRRLDPQLRAGDVQERPPHQLEPDDGRDPARDGAGDHRVLLRPEARSSKASR